MIVTMRARRVMWYMTGLQKYRKAQVIDFSKLTHLWQTG
jgi:hypothetical protein